jgi:hypothetical protein
LLGRGRFVCTVALSTDALKMYNLTSTDVHFGRGQTILERRARIKHKTIALRRKLHQQLAVSNSTKMDPSLS